MSEPTVDCDPFEVVAELFRSRFRSGQRPSVEEFAARYPELAQQIRDLLPALVMVERTSHLTPTPVPMVSRPAPIPSRNRPASPRRGWPLSCLRLVCGDGSGTFTARNRQTGRLSPKGRILVLRERSP